MKPFPCAMSVCFAAIVALCAASNSHAQVVFTEVMHSPGGDDALWEWVEIVNTSAAPIDLDGWVFDDDDDGRIGSNGDVANISASGGNNTIVPAGGVAVLYSADDLDLMPERFNSAWGGGITLIGVNSFTSLAAADSIGLWPNYNSYEEDSPTGSSRTFTNAVAVFDYADVALPDDGHSIAWNGSGTPSSPLNWIASQPNDQYGAFSSDQTTIENAQINSTEDRGNPGILPGGTASAGLRITEIMFAPESPAVTVGYAEADFEWIEVLNNTPNPINFAQTPYVFDDTAGSKLSAGNIRGGTIAVGATAILFNNERISVEQMQDMWGDALNYIPVENWSSLNNTGGDTIAIWDSYGDYNSEVMTGSPRTYANAVAAMTYGTVMGQGWPTPLSGRSIWLNDPSGDPNVGANWTRAGASGDGLSFQASGIFETSTDHPGEDVGSPGFVPGNITPTLQGDYNGDGRVDAADYVVLRKTDGAAGGYSTWRANFGRSAFGSSTAVSAAVPEPSSFSLMTIAAILRNLAASLATRRR